MEPSISVIMVDGSFRERFHAVGALARQTLADDAHELIWVEYFDAIRPDLQADLEKHPNSCTLKLGRGGIYHSSYCFNAGIMAANGDLVVIPDADVVVEEDFLQRILALHDNHEKLAVPGRIIFIGCRNIEFYLVLVRHIVLDMKFICKVTFDSLSG